MDRPLRVHQRPIEQRLNGDWAPNAIAAVCAQWTLDQLRARVLP